MVLLSSILKHIVRVLKYGIVGMLSTYLLIIIIDKLFFLGFNSDLVILTSVIGGVIAGCTGRVIQIIDVKFNTQTNNTNKKANDLC